MTQTLLLDVPPRSLSLDAPIWGCDVSTKRVALAVLYGERPHVTTDVLTLEQLDMGPRRLAGAFQSVLGWAGRIAATRGRPAYVLLEQPFAKGRNVHPQSQFMVGVVQAALARALGNGPIIDLIDPSQWKRLALGAGHGHAEKPEILAWAREAAGYEGSDLDEADSVGIATAAAVRYVGRRVAT